jgi:hypothetical protein
MPPSCIFFAQVWKSEVVVGANDGHDRIVERVFAIDTEAGTTTKTIKRR